MKSRDKEDQGRESNEGKVDIRVTDRRRSYLNDNDDAGSVANAETPRLKPTYVEELEARTQAAEQSARDIQTRFEQLKTRLQQETDETRQRLNRAADERAQRAKTDLLPPCFPCSTIWSGQRKPPTRAAHWNRSRQGCDRPPKVSRALLPLRVLNPCPP